MNTFKRGYQSDGIDEVEDAFKKIKFTESPEPYPLRKSPRTILLPSSPKLLLFDDSQDTLWVDIDPFSFEEIDLYNGTSDFELSDDEEQDNPMKIEPNIQIQHEQDEQELEGKIIIKPYPLPKKNIEPIQQDILFNIKPLDTNQILSISRYKQRYDQLVSPTHQKFIRNRIIKHYKTPVNKPISETYKEKHILSTFKSFYVNTFKLNESSQTWTRKGPVSIHLFQTKQGRSTLFGHYLYGTYFIAFNFYIYIGFLEMFCCFKDCKRLFIFSTAGRNSHLKAVPIIDDDVSDSMDTGSPQLVESTNIQSKPVQIMNVEILSTPEYGSSKWAIQFYDDKDYLEFKWVLMDMMKKFNEYTFLQRKASLIDGCLMINPETRMYYKVDSSIKHQLQLVNDLAMNGFALIASDRSLTIRKELQEESKIEKAYSIDHEKKRVDGIPCCVECGLTIDDPRGMDRNSIKLLHSTSENYCYFKSF